MLTRTLLAAATLTSVAAAQLSVVIPAGTAAVDGNSSNAFPWGRGGTGLYHQCVYDSSHFTSQGITYPIIITGVRWRPNTGVGLAATGYATSTVKLSTCPVDQAAVTTSLAGNQGADLTTCFSGAVNWPAQPAQTGPTPFGIVVPFTNNFLYDPSAGDLNIEVDLPIQSPAPSSFQLDVVGTGALASRVFVSTGYPGTGNGTIGLNHGVVVQIDYVPASGLYPAFNADVTSGTSPLTVNFTDNTFTSAPGGVLGWAWDFDGDSVIDSTLQNPTWTYTNCGTYTVSLTAVDGVNPPSTITRTNLITTDAVVADFTYAQIAPGVFQFTDTSSPTPTSWAWDLDGDNVVDDTTQNPAFFYPNPCTAVNVTLTASRLCGAASTKSAQIVISPNTLTAQTAGGNGTTSTTVVGNVFDLEVVNPKGAAICAVSMRPYTFTGPYNLSIYVSEGSYLDLVGGVVRHQVPSAWRLIGTGSGVSAGGSTTTAPLSLVTLNNTVYLPQGKYCMALLINNPAGTAYVCYTTGTATNAGPFADANMIVSPNPTTAPGGAKYNLFGTGINSPRIWNGAFHYATHADDGKANFGHAANGCAGALGVPTLTAAGVPQLGTTLTVTAGNLPLSAMILITGFGRQPAPLDLTPYGAPGCSLAVAVDASNFQLGAGNQSVWNFAVPVDPAFSGMVLFNQALALDPTANTLGAVMSDATGMVLGN